MFFTDCSPRSAKLAGIFPLAALRTDADTATPPGGASPSSRDAMFTPSPQIVPSGFSITSPRCTPMRNRIRRSSGSACAARSRACWIDSAAADSRDTAPLPPRCYDVEAS
jgi:hypothetical protein